MAGVDAQRPQEPPQRLARGSRGVRGVPAQLGEQHAVRELSAHAVRPADRQGGFPRSWRPADDDQPAAARRVHGPPVRDPVN
jgi:hypothetical protein